MNFIDFYNKAQVDPIGGLINDYRDRVLNDGGSFFNPCLRTRLNAELPFENRLNILPANGVGVGKVYAFKGSDYTFTRAGNAYRFNTAGNLVQVGNDVPRINITQSACPQLVIEPQLTNRFTNNQIASGFAIESSFRTLGTPIPDYFGTGISAMPINDNVTGIAQNSNTRIRQYDGRLRNRVFSCLISNPLTNFFHVTLQSDKIVFNLQTLETVQNPNYFGVIRKIKDNVWFVSAMRNDTAGLQFEQVRISFVGAFNLNVLPVVTGTWLIGVPSLFLEEQATSNILRAGYVPYPVGSSAVTKLADVATLAPPSGTTEIIVNNQAPITSIPSTFQIPNGLIDKIVMQ